MSLCVRVLSPLGGSKRCDSRHQTDTTTVERTGDRWEGTCEAGMEEGEAARAPRERWHLGLSGWRSLHSTVSGNKVSSSGPSLGECRRLVGCAVCSTEGQAGCSVSMTGPEVSAWPAQWEDPSGHKNDLAAPPHPLPPLMTAWGSGATLLGWGKYSLLEPPPPQPSPQGR